MRIAHYFSCERVGGKHAPVPFWAIKMCFAVLFICIVCSCPSLAHAQEIDGSAEMDAVQVVTSVGVDAEETPVENLFDGESSKQTVGECEGEVINEEEAANSESSADFLPAEETKEDEPESDVSDTTLTGSNATSGIVPEAAAEAAPEAVLAVAIAAVEVPEAGASAQPAPTQAPAAKAAAQQAHTASVSYRVHVQNVGTQSWRSDGQTAGTSGRSLRLESIEFKVSSDLSGAIYCRVHVQNDGWQRQQGAVVGGSAKSGTEGRSLRLEAVEFTLSGELSKWYDVFYRVHVQNDGWQDWKNNGQLAGTSGRSLRLEALEIKLVEKASAPTAWASDGSPGLVYRAHVQNVGWQPQVASGQTAGTSGQSLRVEALQVWLEGAAYSGGVTCQAHVQNIGWQKAASNGAVSGTTGRGLRVEALRLTLTGDIAKYYDVVYRAHVQGVGWQPWVVNGGLAGTTGRGLRVEAVQAKLVCKGSYSVSEGAYEVTPASDASFALDDPGYSTSSGAQMQVCACSGNQAQKYYVRSEGSGTYSVQVVASGLFLADRSGKVVQVADSASDATQRWKMSWDGGVLLSNASTGMVLSLASSAPSNGAKAVTQAKSPSASQRWVLGTTQLIADGTYIVTNAAKGMGLDVDGMSYSNGANVMVHESNDGGNQAFTITNKGKDAYTITCAMTGKVVDVANGSTTNNTNVRQWQANGSNAQLWTAQIDRSGKISFKNKSSSRYLSAAGDGSSNSNVISSSTTAEINRKWMLRSSSYKPDTVLQRAMSIANGLSSSTGYLVTVDLSNHRTVVFEGSRNNWTPIKNWICSTGAPSTPTVVGDYTVGIRGYSFGHGYTCYYYTQFYGDYLFHSVLYDEGTSVIQDGRLGYSISQGCVRLKIENARWIYDTIPYGTHVKTYY